MLSYSSYCESADYIKKSLHGFRPEALIILGSGLGALGDMAEDASYIPYEDIPYFVRSTVIGHRGRLVAGTLSGRKVLIMQGRFHPYEGYDCEQVVFPVRVARLLGVDTLIVTNAAGGVNLSFSAGDLMLIRDYIKFNVPNPLIGPNMDEFGPRFPDMSYTFDREYLTIFREVVEARGGTVREGNYFYMSGPQYETPAEIRAIRTLGGDAVGMSTVHECIAANHMGMRTLGISLITNMAAGVVDKPLSADGVVAAASAAGATFRQYMLDFLERM